MFYSFTDCQAKRTYIRNIIFHKRRSLVFSKKWSMIFWVNFAKSDFEILSRKSMGGGIKIFSFRTGEKILKKFTKYFWNKFAKPLIEFLNLIIRGYGGIKFCAYQSCKKIKPHWTILQCGFTHISHILFCCVICARFPPICSFLIPMDIKWYQTKMRKTTFLQGKRALPQEFEPPCFH